jgi:hypothetical protein
VLHAIAGWYDSLELWIVGLPFIPQVALLLGVMVPVGYLIAKLADGVINVVFDRLHDIQVELRIAAPPNLEELGEERENRTAVDSLSGPLGNGGV